MIRFRDPEYPEEVWKALFRICGEGEDPVMSKVTIDGSTYALTDLGEDFLNLVLFGSRKKFESACRNFYRIDEDWFWEFVKCHVPHVVGVKIRCDLMGVEYKMCHDLISRWVSCGRYEEFEDEEQD